MRTVHNKATAHIFQFAHDHDRRARHFDYDSRDLTFRSVIKQVVVDVYLLQEVYSIGVLKSIGGGWPCSGYLVVWRVGSIRSRMIALRCLVASLWTGPLRQKRSLLSRTECSP